MTAKQYLKQIRDLDSRAWMWGAYAKLCRDDAYRLGRADFAHAVDKLVDYQRDAEERQERYSEERMKIIEQVDKLSYPYRDILYRHYVDGETLKEIMLEMRFTSYKYVARLHGHALQIFARRFLKN